MNYHFRAGTDDALRTINRHSGFEVLFCSRSRLRARYPDGGYTVVGEIGNCAERYRQMDIIEIDAERSIPVFPLGSCRWPWEWVAGYACLGDDTYVAVVKGIIPRFIGWWGDQ